MFVLHTLGSVSTPPMEYLPVIDTVKPTIGLAMVMEEGLLTKASGTTVPTYICMTQRDDFCAAGELIPVIRVQHGIVFATTFAVDAQDISLGNKLTIADDGLSVTATTASGVAEVVKMDGTDQGDTVYVRF